MAEPRKLVEQWSCGFVPNGWDRARPWLSSQLKSLERIFRIIHGAVELLAGHVIGGTSLTLTSVNDSTKSKIYFGSAQTSAFDESNNRLGIGTSSPTAPLTIAAVSGSNIIVTGAVDGEQRISSFNTNASGTGAVARLRASANDTSLIDINAHGAGRTATRYGITLASWSEVVVTGGNGLLLGTTTATPVVVGTNNLERLRVDSPGNVSIGTGALATTATDGFLYIPTCAGAPTGTPTAKTGRVPLIFDTTNNRLYVYDGGWISAAFA